MEHANNNEKQVPLSLDEDVVDKANAVGLNIATIIERLRSTPYEQKGNAATVDVAKAYDSLFYAIRPLIRFEQQSKDSSRTRI